MRATSKDVVEISLLNRDTKIFKFKRINTSDKWKFVFPTDKFYSTNIGMSNLHIDPPGGPFLCVGSFVDGYTKIGESYYNIRFRIKGFSFKKAGIIFDLVLKAPTKITDIRAYGVFLELSSIYGNIIAIDNKIKEEKPNVVRRQRTSERAKSV